MVTPEFVDPIDACEVPCGGPGMFTTSPTNRGLYCAGHMEVPTACNPTNGLGSCGQDPCGNCGGCQLQGGCSTCRQRRHERLSPMPTSATAVCCPAAPATTIPARQFANGLEPRDQMYRSQHWNLPPASTSRRHPQRLPAPQQGAQNLPEDISLPVEVEDHNAPPAAKPATPAIPVAAPKAVTTPRAAAARATPQCRRRLQRGTSTAAGTTPVEPADDRCAASAQPSAPCTPRLGPTARNASRSSCVMHPDRTTRNPRPPAGRGTAQNGLIGPVGYDVHSKP